MHKSILFGKNFWKIFLVVNTLIIVFFWLQGSLSLFSGGVVGVALAFGRIAGFFAAFAVLVQFFLMGRNPLLERVFGLDKLSRVHQSSGKLALGFILLHPLLVTLSYSLSSGISYFAQTKTFILEYEYVWLAYLAFWLFVLIVASSLIIVRRKFKYESWYFVHLAVYLAIFGSFFHQIEYGGTLTANTLFYGYWIVLYLLVLVSHMVFRFGRPLYRFFVHRFKIERIVRENYNTISLYISGKALNNYPVKPGQFMIFRFLTRGAWWQAHPFSLSKVPDGQQLRITIKELGDYTSIVKNFKVGTRVIIDGPYGVFTDFFSVSKSALFIAGGIGITPIRSLMEEMLAKGKKVTLLYANRTQEDIVFKEELESLSMQYNTSVTHVLNKEPDFTGEHGYIDKEKILKYAPDVKDLDIYLCGPPPMMNGVLAVLHALGVPSAHIHFEKFSLR